MSTKLAADPSHDEGDTQVRRRQRDRTSSLPLADRDWTDAKRPPPKGLSDAPLSSGVLKAC
jgi:hypothetical protein